VILSHQIGFQCRRTVAEQCFDLPIYEPKDPFDADGGRRDRWLPTANSLWPADPVTVGMGG
jgi:hypothetical protein